MHSYEHFWEHTSPTQLATWAAVLSIISKEILYRITVRIGGKQRSQLLIANAWHHRSDVVSSAVALVGIVGSQLGWHLLDPLAGVVVAAMIAKIGINTGWESLKELTDASVAADIEHKAMEIFSQYSSEMKVQQIRTRKMGPYIILEASVDIPSEQVIPLKRYNLYNSSDETDHWCKQENYK
jgi:cation diffusion facilitator family transporter